MTDSKTLLLALLAIPSPTHGESEKADFLMAWLASELPQFDCRRHGHSIVATHSVPNRPSLAFVGHIDTVPEFFEPYCVDGRIYGSGASDMQAGLASFLMVVRRHVEALAQRYSVTIVLYDKEEGTSLQDNGLYHIIHHSSHGLPPIDVAIVAEPTNNTVQLGCVGSVHCNVTVKGKAAHSARPWHGDNALYKALPLIQSVAQIEPRKHTLFGVDFFDVIDITQSHSTPGRTTVPDEWVANVNYRFAPGQSVDDAMAYVTRVMESSGVVDRIEWVDAVGAGQVVNHPLLEKAARRFPLAAKQAWTDVAQLSDRGICAFNFGPGRQDQAHCPTEYVVHADMEQYEAYLILLLLEDKL